MSDQTLRPARLVTVFGTVLYAEVASGELRHGAPETCPGNAVLVANFNPDGAVRRARLAIELGDERKVIVCGAEDCRIGLCAEADDASTAPIEFEVIPLERGLFALRAGDFFLSAVPDGSMRLWARICSTWELFLASEVWCAEAPAVGEATDWHDGNHSFDRKRIKEHIVHPLHRVRANTSTDRAKLLIFGYTKWSHGRVYYDLCTLLHRLGYVVDILDWRVSHAQYVWQLIDYYDLFMTALDGMHTLVDIYKVPTKRIIAVSHHEFDIRILIEQKGIDVFESFANYGVVSEFLYCASIMRGVRRTPTVAPLGINYSEFYSEISKSLSVVGYGSSMATTTYGVEWKRGHLAEAATRAAGLDFKVAGSTEAQMSFHDMPDFYRTVDAVVTSSISEAAQLPVMEAAAAGRLVIGTPVGHFPAKAYQGGGLLAPVEVEKFKKFTAATLRYYRENPAAYVEKCRSIQEAARNFDWQHSIDDWARLIQEARPDWRRRARLNELEMPCTDESVLFRLDLKAEYEKVKKRAFAGPTRLCNLMSSFGSDKGGKFHNYTTLYDQLFSQFAADKLAIFELGLGTNKAAAPSTMGEKGRPGASLRGWRAYFDAAMVYGADIDRDILFDEDRIQTYWVDQRDSGTVRELWEQVGDGVQFDIMIDDGLHEPAANILFFTESFRKLKSGGLFIIEDIATTNVNTMTSFARSIGPKTKCVILEQLGHNLNKSDNRLLIVQKK